MSKLARKPSTKRALLFSPSFAEAAFRNGAARVAAQNRRLLYSRCFVTGRSGA
jgi:hypothetical protein